VPDGRAVTAVRQLREVPDDCGVTHGSTSTTASTTATTTTDTTIINATTASADHSLERSLVS
jgi:hypothetical protein